MWTGFAYKGGSEPGVVFLSWLLHARDGRRLVVVASAVDPTDPVDELELAAIAQGAIELLGPQERSSSSARRSDRAPRPAGAIELLGQ
jgi:hypothetical protein